MLCAVCVCTCAVKVWRCMYAVGVCRSFIVVYMCCAVCVLCHGVLCVCVWLCRVRYVRDVYSKNGKGCFQLTIKQKLFLPVIDSNQLNKV